MSVRHRFFVDRDGPVVRELHILTMQRRSARVAFDDFMKATGASEAYGNSPATYVFDFPSADVVDRHAWRETPKRRGTYYFTPRKNTPEGKAIAAKVAALPNCPSLQDAIRVIPGLQPGWPVVSDGDGGYAPHVRYYDHNAALAIVSVPWADYPAEQLARYKADRAAGTHSSVSLDHALWVAPEWLVEIKEWEALKMIDESSATQEGP